jgi:hypothetical protein
MAADNLLLKGALELAARGIPVISLRPRSKVPLHARWTEYGMLDPDHLRVEWGLNPDSNVGVLCGADAFGGDGLTVVDIDLPDGPTSLERFESETGERLPETLTVMTPSGGGHLYYRGATASWNPAPGLEVRSIGRQCAAPPSVLVGGGYAWMEPQPPIAAAPRWLGKPVETRATERPARCDRGDRRPLNDPVLEVPPPRYFEVLTGLVPDREGFVCCPIHGEDMASLKVYATADRGWFCYGESCRRGGDVITLAAELAGIPTPVRGAEFVGLLEYLRGRLL